MQSYHDSVINPALLASLDDWLLDNVDLLDLRLDMRHPPTSELQKCLRRAIRSGSSGDLLAFYRCLRHYRRSLLN
jgi:hypothetical protein